MIILFTNFTLKYIFAGPPLLYMRILTVALAGQHDKCKN
jgi:hypothetical protein